MKLIIVTGVTGSGKSQKAIEIYNENTKHGLKCVILSADSRQVYKFCTLSANIEQGEFKKYNNCLDCYEVLDTPHFFLSFVDPKQIYNLSKYLQDFKSILEKLDGIDLIILVGGTGLYIDAIKSSYKLENIKQNYLLEFEKYRNSLDLLTLPQLQSLMVLNCKDIYSTLNNSDKNNKRRLISKISNNMAKKCNWLSSQTFNFCFDDVETIVLPVPKNLKSVIEKRLIKRIELGLMGELEWLYNYVGHERMASLGMFYSIYSDFKAGKISDEELFDKLVVSEIQYCKRQITWNKKYFT